MYIFITVIEFKILKKSKKSWARVGILKTPHGEVETPTLVPVATKAVIKTLTSEEVLATKTKIKLIKYSLLAAKIYITLHIEMKGFPLFIFPFYMMNITVINFFIREMI